MAVVKINIRVAMAMTEQQKRQMNAYLDQMSAAELNRTLESQSNFRNWLYREHYPFYVQVKDVLDELWEMSKKVAKGVLEAAGYVVGAAVCVAAAPFYIVGNILGLWD